MAQNKPQNEPKEYLNAYHVETFKVGHEERAKWTKIGVAFPHDDGDGFNVELTCFPIDGRIVIRKPKEKDGEV